MYRLATLVGLAAFLVPNVAAASETAKPAPATIQVAHLKPTLSDVPDPVEQAVFNIRPLRKAAPLASRFARGPRLVTRVDVSDQEMKVYLDGELLHIWKVSTGGKGYVTPTGSWKPYRMHTMWYSRKYDNAPMPHSIFYDGGYAIHATPHIKRLGRPASHGCVRLHPENAELLFRLAKEVGRDNMQVVVQN